MAIALSLFFKVDQNFNLNNKKENFEWKKY
jgi:hypothetical protein